MLALSGMTLRKWRSNSQEVLETIPETLKEKEPVFASCLIRVILLFTSLGDLFIATVGHLPALKLSERMCS